ncbi:MAG TPA: hypothetical protein VMS00_09485 [Acidimicrobiales bacterium]|nr:hypothetical protein [Acidimicrobiales bacterium]
MDIALTISLSAEDEARLRTSLGAKADLTRIATAIANAGANEFLEQATGRVVPGAIREARLFRIYQLLKAGVTLLDAQAIVAAVFKETPGRARGLVESAIARYDVELRASVDARVQEVLDAATWQDPRWEVELPSGFVRDRVLAAAADTSFADPSRAGRGAVYQFPDETYQAVREAFQLRDRPKPKK